VDTSPYNHAYKTDGFDSKLEEFIERGLHYVVRGQTDGKK
jgi:hypothetical protein